jgi:sulfate transport system permease protein
VAPPAEAAGLPVARPRRSARRSGRLGTPLALGIVTTFLGVVVVLPIAAVVWQSKQAGGQAFWSSISNPEAVAALKLTVGAAIVVALVNGVIGTVIAWVLVRDEFPGKSLVNAVIDLPFALPTIVAGLTLLALYGNNSPVGVHVAYTRAAVVLALLFVTLPFVVRTVQPVLHELDREMEEAARSLGARETTVFLRIVLPSLLPGILSGVALALARAVGEIGSVVLITGNLPYRTEVASVYVLNLINAGNPAGASAVAAVLLGLSFAILLGIGGVRFLVTRHERA